MPYDIDLSYEIREQPEVKEYILIADMECCGKDSETWSQQREYYGNSFDQETLDNLSALQLCRTDRLGDIVIKGKESYSKTYLFTRKEK